ncbi:MAG TPA: adenylate/guanylate cyclase domain-containing protein [Mycobacteriales bacterium]|nr:adenylate/guanylate cyclase domain-containing protein [Mycobacteriales bacterium]
MGDGPRSAGVTERPDLDSAVAAAERAAVRGTLPARVLRTAGAETSARTDGTLLFTDVSGFTALSERLAGTGRPGAEELSRTIGRVFEVLLSRADALGGDTISFGGDAVLLWFEGEHHAERAAVAALRMRAALSGLGPIRTIAGPVRLRVSQGLDSGRATFVTAGTRHRVLLPVGNAANAAVQMEAIARADEIVVSDDTAALLPPAALGRAVTGGRLLQRVPMALAEAVDLTAADAAAPVEVAPGWDEHLAQFVPATLRGHLAVTTAESEHRLLSAAFLQASGVDTLLHTEGPAAVAEALGALLDTVADLAATHGVTLCQADAANGGAKLLLASGAPVALEADAEAMLRVTQAACAWAVQHSPFTVRAGVTRGRVYVGRTGSHRRWVWTILGDTVNLAARLAVKAEPGTVLAAANVLDRCPGRFAVTPVPPFTVKGKSAPVDALVVGAPLGAARAVEVGRERPLIGRTDELALILDALDDAGGGAGVAVEIVGDPGVGKSRLVREALRQRSGVPAVLVTCERWTAQTPFHASAQLLRQVLGIPLTADAQQAGEAITTWIAQRMPRLSPWVPLIAAAAQAEVDSTTEVDDIAPQHRPARMRRVVSELLEHALPAPAAVVLEDWQWADPASQELLDPVAGGRPSQAWCVVRTFRERPGTHALGGAADPHLRRLHLRPLPAEDALALARQAAGQSDLLRHELEALAEKAAGNPLFLLQLLESGAGLGEDLPDTVEALVSTRIDRLPPDDRRLLRYAAVVGSRIELGLLRSVLRDQLPGLADLPAVELLGRLGDFVALDGPSRLRFSHELLRQVAYDTLPFARRRELHARVGLALESDPALGGAPAERLAALALHFGASDDHARTWRYARQAAHVALTAWAPREAVTLLEQALAASDKLDDLAPTDVLDTAEKLGDTSEQISQFAAARVAYERARRLAKDGDPVPRARLMRKLATLHERGGRYPAAVRGYFRALSELDAAPDDPSTGEERARLHVALGGVRYRQGKLEDAMACARQGAAEAGRAAAVHTLAHAWEVLDISLIALGRADEAVHLAASLALYEQAGDVLRQGNVLNNLGVRAEAADDWEDALDFYRRGRAARDRAGDLVLTAVSTSNVGEALIELGRPGEAIDGLNEALTVFRRAQYPVGEATTLVALGRACAGMQQWDAAAQCFAEGIALFRRIGAKAEAAAAERRLTVLPLSALEQVMAAISGAASD